MNQLIELDTQIIQIRLFGENDIVDLMDSLFVLKRSRVKKVELFLEDNNYDFVLFDDIIQSDGRFELIIYSTKQNLNRDMSINYVLEKILPHSKEIIDESMFVANIPFYMESLRHNVGLNKKICIDLDGSIKNFVNHSKSYGNVVNTKLKDVIAQKQFRWYWYTCNDKIETCNVCQFRYMCLSNSDIIMKDKKLYKKDKCNFDPYLNIWTK